MGLGNVFSSLVLEAEVEASMRPRPLGLGNDVRFQAAPLGSICFNEAEAVGPRKCPQLAGRHVVGVLASMRPRPLGLGNANPNFADETRFSRFNEAEAVGPRKWSVWKKRERGVERFNEAEAVGPRKCLRRLFPAIELTGASMRPRPLGLGNGLFPTDAAYKPPLLQ